MLRRIGFHPRIQTSGSSFSATRARRSQRRLWTKAIAPLVVALMAFALPVSPARAASSAWGAQLGTYNREGVYSNGPVSTYVGPDVGEGAQYQCVELIQRYFHDKFGTVARWPNVPTAASMFSVTSLPTGLSRYANGTAMRPAAGDALVFAAISGWSSGHAALVTAVSATAVSFVQQNVVWAGADVWSDSLPIDGSNRIGSQSARVIYPPVLGWIHAGTTAVASTMTSPAPGSQFGGSNVTFTWTSGTSVSAHWLYVGTSSGGAQLFNSGQLSSAVTSLTVPGLPTDGRTIYVRLWSQLPSGWSLLDYTHRAAQATVQVPAAPSNVVVTATRPTNIHVTWSDNATNETGYRITNSLSTVLLGANATSFDWPTNPSTYQCLAVQAYNSAGASAWTTWACTTTPAATPTVPAAPSNVVVTATSPTSIHAAWSDNATNETGYRITNSLSTVLLGANATSFDWPTNPSTYQCLAVQAYNSAGASAWTTWACTTTPSAGYGDVVVDDQSGGFVRAGTASYWHEYAGGYNGHFWWTYTNTSGVDDRAMWTPTLPAPGRWEVYAFVPSPDGTTTNARYRVDHQGVQTTVSVNQNAYSNVWVSLGIFTFNAGTGGDVFLGDETYETATQQIAFDAIKWVWRGP